MDGWLLPLQEAGARRWAHLLRGRISLFNGLVCMRSFSGAAPSLVAHARPAPTRQSLTFLATRVDEWVVGGRVEG